jgi:signal transduction histidine kinase
VNQSSPVDATSGVASATQRGAGSALAPRNWGVTGWLILLVAVPTVLALALTGLRVTDVMRSARADGQVSRLAVLGQQISGLAQAMEDERSDTAAFLADGRPAAGLAALHRQYVVTDGWAATVRRQVGQLGRGYQPQTQASAATVLASTAELPGLRRQAAERQASALAVINAYSGATAGLFGVNDSIADSSGNSALISSVRALGSLSRMKDAAAQQQAILGAALAEGHFGPGALVALTVAQARQASYLASFRSSATPEESWALTDTLAGPLAAQARAVEQRAAQVGTGPLVLGARARQQWRAGMSYTVGWMRQAEQQLGTWTTAYAQALRRGAIQSAVITGGVALAVLIVVLLAAWAMVWSVGRRLRRLEWLAGEEARLRGSIGAIFASYFGRSQALLERLLRHIDGLELGEDDPERLASLFQMDHLATRMRRNSDSALVLAGLQTPGGRSEPVTLVDVLRAAVSEIEQYDRVVLDIQQGVWVSGSAAADTAHLLAELLENATTFSPQATRVVVSGHATRGGGSLISISDGGTGLPEEHLRQLNEKLAHPPLAGPAVVTQMGLVAVAHLAARHGTTVTLTPRPGGGTTAEVRLPAALISQDARPGGWPRQAGAGLRPGTGRGAFGPAAELRPAWVPAGPELAAGPRITAPDGVPVTLGAPLPYPATSASGQVIMPEPVGTEPGAALPIFESVESDYLQAHGQGRPGAAVADVPVDGAAVADVPVDGDLTSAGLPRRIPQANLVPDGAAAGRPPGQATAAVSAQIALGRLASFQRGSRRARARARINRDATRPAQGD